MLKPASPELRAHALAEVLRHSALIPGPATAAAIFQSTQSALRLREEDCATEIYGAIAFLVRAGLLCCNTTDPSAGGLIIAASTLLTPSRPLLAAVWADPDASGSEGGDA